MNTSVISERKTISEIKAELNGKLLITIQLLLKEKVFVSRDRAGEFKSWLES